MFNRRPGCARWLVWIGLGVLLLFLFRYELGMIRSLVRYFTTGILVEGAPTLPQAIYILVYWSLNAAAVVLFVLLLVYWTAGSVHPTQNVQQTYQLMRRVAHALTGRPNPIWMIREADPVNGAGHLGWSDLAEVDLDSALVFEGRGVSSAADQQAGIGGTGETGVARPIMARIGRPGLVFIQSGERLRGIVSLRKQLRMENDVFGQTRDGIEVWTNVYCLFTLGQPPDVIQVAYFGARIPEELRVLVIDPQTRRIKTILDELDAQEKEEVHRFAIDFIDCIDPDSPLVLSEQGPAYPPFTIDERRIEAAVYSKAYNVNYGLPYITWTDLPVMVAAEVFRNMISPFTYDELYLPESPAAFPLIRDIKPAFARQVRSLGALSYQFVHRSNGEAPEIDQHFDHRQFRVAPAREFQSSRVLRDRGIKVIQAGFSEVSPTDPTVRLQRFRNWQVRWQERADWSRIDLDNEVIHIRDVARATRQREMIDNLSDLLHNSPYSEEVLMLRILQSLEDAAADPRTRQMLPLETLDLLGKLRSFLLPPSGPNFLGDGII